MQTQDTGNKPKTFFLTSIALENKTSVFVITAIIVIYGLISYNRMPREAFPEVTQPQVYISTAYPGNSAQDIERLISEPIEKEVNTISTVDKITSTSVEDFSSISVTFTYDVTPEEAVQKVKDKVDAAMGKPTFPTDLPAEPNIFELNFSELAPAMSVNISGDYSNETLREYADLLKDEIEKLDEVSKVELNGAQDKEVEVTLDLNKMAELELTFNDIINIISNENMTMSSGSILIGDYRRSIRVLGEFTTIDDILNLIVRSKQGSVAYMRDVAEVAFKEVETESYARYNNNSVLQISIFKRAGENLIATSEKVDKVISEIKKDYLPDDVVIFKTNDMSENTKAQVDELENSIIFGILLVVGVLMFFLGLRNALFVGMAIPMSMFLSFIILDAAGITLNGMVLFSLVLALGMLVDNGIVVVENIYRLMSKKQMTKGIASRIGVGEVAVAIIAATATTLAAFFPLLIWPGIIGQFMKNLPITLIIVLGSSLFVALIINPVFTSYFMKVEEKNVPMSKIYRRVGVLSLIAFLFISLGMGSDATAMIVIGNLILFLAIIILLNKIFIIPSSRYIQGSFLPKLESVYGRFLSYALRRRPYMFFFGTILMLVFSLGLFGVFTPQVLFFPENDPNQIYVLVEAPIGTDIKATNKLSKDIEKKVLDYVKKYEVATTKPDGTTYIENKIVKSVITTVGKGSSSPNNMNGGGTKNTNNALVFIDLVKFNERGTISSAVMMEEIRELFKDEARAIIKIEKNSIGPPTGAPVSIAVEGYDYKNIMYWVEEIRTEIGKRKIAGIENLSLDVEKSVPQMPIYIDREKAQRFKLSTRQIASTIRTALYGAEASRFKDGDDDYPINIRLKSEDRYNPETLLNQIISFRNRDDNQLIQIPVASVAHYEKTTNFEAVKRKDLNRVITLYSNVIEGYNPTAINAEIQGVIQEMEIPSNIKVSFTGEQEQQAKELAFLSEALIIAVFIIFLILVSQFNSILSPFIIVGSVILSLIGVFLGLVLFQMDFVVIMTMIGIISLAGIVVNNAIVLIDYINLTIKQRKQSLGLDVEDKLSLEDTLDAISIAGKTRLKPVLLTATTTILGLLPLATGMNINFFSLFTTYDAQIYFGGDNVAFWGPISWTIIFGLIFATFLTLIIVPVSYYIAHLISSFTMRKRTKSEVVTQ